MDEQAFLARVRKAMARTAPSFGHLLNDHAQIMRQHGAEPAPRQEVPDAPRCLGELLGLPAADDQTALASHWAQEYGKLGGRPRIAAGPAEAAAALVETAASVLKVRGGFCIVTAHPLLESWGLLAALTSAGLPVELYRGPEDRERLAQATLGITVATAAIAETGTLVIESHTHQGRYSSLLPPVHMAVIPPGALVPGVAGWLAGRGSRYRAGEEMPSSTAFATGPSRSADIAGDLALGVHGPGEVHAVVVLG